MSVRLSSLPGFRLGLAACLALTGCDVASSSLGHAEAVVGSGGGSVSLDTGSADGARIDVGAGAVDVDTRFSIEASSDADHLAAGMHAIGPVVTFGPEGARFALPVHVTLPAASEPMVLLTRPHGGTTWTRVDGAVWDAAHHVVVADVPHFSDFVPVDRDSEMPGDASTIVDAGPPIQRDSGIDCSDPRFAGYPVCTQGYECDLFTGGCAAGYANCYPPDDTTTHGTCSSAGASSIGQPCTFEGYDHETDCTGGLRCDTTTVGATGTCREICDPSHACFDDGITIVDCQTAPGAAFGFCEPVGVHCHATETPETTCTGGIDEDCDTLVDCADSDCRLDPACAVSTCDALAGSGCAAGQHCGIHTVDASVDSTVVAACFANGAGAVGDGCASGADCGDGLTCAAITGWSTGAGEETHWYFTSFEGYFTRGGGLCVSLCAGGDWTTSSCTGGQICHQIENVGAPSGYGACYAPRSAP